MVRPGGRNASPASRGQQRAGRSERQRAAAAAGPGRQRAGGARAARDRAARGAPDRRPGRASAHAARGDRAGPRPGGGQVMSRGQREPIGPGHDAAVPGRTGDPDARGQRRRASRSLWAACEALLSAEPRAMSRALDALAHAFDCEGVAIHAVAPTGVLDPLCARGEWRLSPGDLRACLSVPLHRADERIGSLDLVARAGRGWTPAQMSLVRTAAGALGAALRARLELHPLRSPPGPDPVTGLPDSTMFHGRLEEELSRSRRQGTPVGLLMLDLDHFGALNKKYGP